MGEHGIDEHRPEGGEHHPRAEAHPLHDRTGDQRHGDDAEGRLEREEEQVGNRRPVARREGDVVQLKTPIGVETLEILAVSYAAS